MLIDDFLPDWDVRERHCTKVHAPPQRVYAAVRQLDLSDARLSMLLFRLRGLRSCLRPSPDFNLDHFLKMGFHLLAEKPEEELVLGLVGRFWTLRGELRRVNTEDFRSFSERGYAKAVWNFSLSRQADETVLLETETRVRCLDEVSRKRFRFYWMLIGGFSGVIRRDVLKAIKRTAEESRSQAIPF